MLFKDLETKRLYLKSITMDDANFILHEFSNADVNQYLYDEEPMANIQEAEDMIQFYLTPEPRMQHRWILVRKEDGIKMGTCGFHRWEENKCEAGYDMLKEFWGNDYMQEAMNAILDFAKNEMKIKQVDLHIYPDNSRSEKLAKRLDFVDYNKTIVYEFRGEKYIHHIYTKFM